jgi:hypothetical protein
MPLYFRTEYLAWQNKLNISWQYELYTRIADITSARASATGQAASQPWLNKQVVLASSLQEKKWVTGNWRACCQELVGLGQQICIGHSGGDELTPSSVRLNQYKWGPTISSTYTYSSQVLISVDTTWIIVRKLKHSFSACNWDEIPWQGARTYDAVNSNAHHIMQAQKMSHCRKTSSVLLWIYH